MGHHMIFIDFFKALAQLGDPRFLRVFLLGVGLSFAILVGLYAALLLILNGLGAGAWIAETIGWSEGAAFGLLTLGSFGLLIATSIFLMLPVASLITSMFLDEVADAVEAKHYPNLPHTPRPSFVDGLLETLGFFGIMLGANILAFILWVIFPFLGPFIFWGLNGYLLGREYFQIAATRHLGRAKAKELFKANRAKVWSAGCLMALPLIIPLVNLLVPVLGAATFTHQFHRLNRTSG